MPKQDYVKAVYKALILERESGKLETLYVCDKAKNTKCKRRFCNTNECQHTLDREYAKDFYKEL